MTFLCAYCSASQFSGYDKDCKLEINFDNAMCINKMTTNVGHVGDHFTPTRSRYYLNIFSRIIAPLAILAHLTSSKSTYMNPTILQNAKKLQMASMRAQRLLGKLTSLPQNAVVLVDGDNIRGKTGFSVSKEQLLNDLQSLTEKCRLDYRLYLYFDHGREHEAFRIRRTTLVFSGERTADDAIVRDVGWWKERYGSHSVIVTADSGLKARCHRAVKAITVIDSNIFLELMDTLIGDKVDQSTISSINNLSPQVLSESFPLSTPQMPGIPSASNLKDLLRLELKLRDQARSLQRLSKLRSGGRKKRAKFSRRLREIEERLQDCLDKQRQKYNKDESSSKFTTIESLDERTLAHLLREQAHDGHGKKREETWERCILAECLRRKLLRSLLLRTDRNITDANIFTDVSSIVAGVQYPLGIEQNDTSMSPSSVYIEEINRNFSRTKIEGLPMMPVGEWVDTLQEGAKPPCDEAEKNSIVAPVSSLSLSRPFSVMELRAQRTLRDHSRQPKPYSVGITSDGIEYSTDTLGCRCFNISLSGRTIKSDEKVMMTLVTIGDTHSMEVALNGLIPEGDVLIHTGDYAEGPGSKTRGRNKNGKDCSKSLDRWLSTLTHPVKIVVRGNRDPLIPELDCSGALHYHSSGKAVIVKREDDSVVAVVQEDHSPSLQSTCSGKRSLQIGIAPYGSQKVPHACDILVSHSPLEGFSMLL